jgi:pimeloyl-ACP methyl ester carboxylesterase
LAELRQETVQVDGVDLRFSVAGKGAPILYLPSLFEVAPENPFFAALAGHRTVYMPVYPGLGGTELPFWMDAVQDFSHLMLHALLKKGLSRLPVVGASHGGWIALDMATKAPKEIERLVLIGPLGLKLGGRDTLDFPDIFAMEEAALWRLLYVDQARYAFRPDKLTDSFLVELAKSKEVMAAISWEPYLHDPKLRHRLTCLDMPVTILRGAGDGIASADYAARFAAIIGKGGVTTIPGTGHLAHIEQPESVLAQAGL